MDHVGRQVIDQTSLTIRCSEMDQN